MTRTMLFSMMPRGDQRRTPLIGCKSTMEKTDLQRSLETQTEILLRTAKLGFLVVTNELNMTLLLQIILPSLTRKPSIKTGFI